jgi:signal transduction histidine kinase
METLSSFAEIQESLAHRPGERADTTLDPLLAELWRLANETDPMTEPQLVSLESLAIAALDAQEPASRAISRVLRRGRALVDVVEAGGRLDSLGVARLRELVDYAAIELGRVIEVGRAARRTAWLSYLSHEIKNPLNTILNALWLLRERGADSIQAARFLELAERAVHKLEDRIRDVRALEEQLVELPPGWTNRLLPKRP